MTTYIDMVGIVLVAIFLVLDWYFGFASQTGQMVSGPLPLSMEGHQYHWCHGHQNVDDVEKK